MKWTAMILFMCTAPLVADAPDGKKVVRLANEYAYCAGFWDAMAAVLAEPDKPASTELMKNTGNGAAAAALYLFAGQHLREHPEEERALGSFSPLVDPRRDQARLATFALVEQGNVDELKRDQEKCTAMLPFQDEILTAIRQNAADAKSE